MRTLLLGGTKFIGRHITEALLRAGHDVSVFARGKTPHELPASVEKLRGDRDAGRDGLRALEGRTFDACVDISGYLPLQVRPAAQMLSQAVSRYVFISTGAVYAATRQVPVTEEHALLVGASESVTEINGETYGPLKVTCEAIVREVFGERAAIVRPQIVAGTHDPYGRYSRWVKRAQLPGPMLLPGDGDDFVQVVDVRDVAALVLGVIAQGFAGVVHAAGPRMTWREFAHVLGVRQGVWVGSDVLAREGVSEQDLPLYRVRGGVRSEGMQMSSDRMENLLARAGIARHSPQATHDAVRAWVQHDRATLGMALERERELLTRAGN
jgi:2'-hydroxyisoflavone reductase